MSNFESDFPDRLQTLLNGLTAIDSNERLAAAQALGELADERAIAPLIYSLADPDQDVRIVVRSALANYGSAAVYPLIAILRTINNRVEEYIFELKEIDTSVLRDDGANIVWDAWRTFAMKDDSDLEKFIGGEIKVMIWPPPAEPIEHDQDPYIWLLKNVRISRLVARALAGLGQKASEAITSQLSDRAVLVRWAVAWALGELKDVKSSIALRASLEDPVPLIREAVLEALIKQGQGQTQSPTDNESQVEAARSAVHSLLFDQTGSSRRYKLARDLKNFGDLALQPLLEIILDTSQPEVLRSDAIWVLGHYKNPKAVEPLITLLADASSKVRSQSAWVLGWFHDRQAVAPLLKLLENSQEVAEVQQHIVQSLGDLGDRRAVSSLIAMLRHDDPKVRTNTAYALGKIGDQTAVEPLIQLLSDKEHEVCRGASEALGKLKDPKALEPLLALIKPTEGPFYVIRALGELGDKRATETLITFLQANDVELQDEAIWALGSLGDNRAVEPLLKALKASSADIRYGAVVALGQLGDERALEILEWISQNDEGYHGNLGKPVSQAAIEAITHIKEKNLKHE